MVAGHLGSAASVVKSDKNHHEIAQKDTEAFPRECGGLHFVPYGVLWTLMRVDRLGYLTRGV